MGLVAMSILDSAGAAKTVILDQVSSDLYPVYKLTVGALGEAGSLVSSSNPLPVQLSDGTDTVAVVGDGDTIDREDEDQTVGTTKGSLIFGVDPKDEARFLRTSEEGVLAIGLQEDYQAAILSELRKMNFQLALITGCSDLQLEDE